MCENEFLDSLDVFDAERKSVEQPPLMAATDKSSCQLNKKRKNTNEGVLLAFTWREKALLSSQTHVTKLGLPTVAPVWWGKKSQHDAHTALQELNIVV